METALQNDAQSCCSSLCRPAVCKADFGVCLAHKCKHFEGLYRKAETCFEVIMWGA